MATRLSKLRLNEISGVDEPANDAPNWIVAKSAEFKAEIDDIERAVVGAYELLSSPEVSLYLGDAPGDVTKARDELIDHLEKDLEEVEEPTETRKGVTQKLREIFGVEKSGNPIQPIVGAPAATREEVDRVTPAEVSSATEDRVTEDQGADELGRDEDGKQVAPPISDGRQTGRSGKRGKKGETVAGNPNQPIVGAPAETREQVDRVTPAETASSSEDRVTEDQGADELGRDEEGDQVAPPVTPPEEFAKAVGDTIADELQPLKGAIEGILDRLEDVEKAAAGSRGLYEEEVEKAADGDSLAGAFARAAHGQRVNLR
jgi:hypothetical protein